MKRLIIFIFSLLYVLNYAQTKKTSINLEIKEIETQNDDVKEKSVEFYSLGVKQLTHILSSELGDCNSISLELGAYEINENKLILYSYWAWLGDAPTAPYGVRKQTYKITSIGTLIFEKGSIYLEIVPSDWALNEIKQFLGNESLEGENYLFTSPSNPEEEEKLKNYKKWIETSYKATFVDNKEEELLFKEVHKKLKKKIKERTQYWEDSDFIYKK